MQAIRKLAIAKAVQPGPGNLSFQRFLSTTQRSLEQRLRATSHRASIKCDERRPACRNCVRVGFQCPGFEQQLRWSKKHERLQTLSQPDRYGAGLGSQVAEDSTPNHATDLSDALQIPHGGLGALAGGSGDAWQDLIPTHQASDLFPDAQVSDGPVSNSTTTCESSSASEPQQDFLSISNPGILQTLVHLPTTLIEYWFRCICPMRSTFDSNINYNRQLARTTWTTSEAVFYTMQAMSAACLLDSMPQLTETLPLLRAQASAAIDKGISQVRASQLPTADLVFAVFALGTSQHWTTPALPEHPWLESARELLFSWRVQLSAADALIHAYFCQALTYWEMLLAAVGRGSIPVKVETKRRQYQGRLRQAMDLSDGDCDAPSFGPLPCDSLQNLLGTRPNSWCGLSNEVIDVFGQVLALCRSARLYNGSELTVATTSRALCDMMYARELQRELMVMDFGSLVLMEEVQGFPVQTGDDKTPLSHLLQTAEAYRQAALLQLHLAFSDLERGGGRILNDDSLPDTTGGSESLFDAVDGGDSNATASGAVGNGQSPAEFLLSLALQLVSTLEQIPAESGSRVTK
ncbi:hypothetical protein ACJ41O_009163 [Fusarium nematophilum]